MYRKKKNMIKLSYEREHQSEQAEGEGKNYRPGARYNRRPCLRHTSPKATQRCANDRTNQLKSKSQKKKKHAAKFQHIQK